MRLAASLALVAFMASPATAYKIDKTYKYSKSHEVVADGHCNNGRGFVIAYRPGQSRPYVIGMSGFLGALVTKEGRSLNEVIRKWCRGHGG